MKIKFWILLLVFTVLLACNLPTAPSNNPLPVAKTVAAVTQKPPQNVPVIKETDACKLYSEEKASALLGETVLPPTPANAPGYSVCMYMTKTGKGVVISITSGEQAKNNLLNEIAQYQKGCSVSYSGGTSTATPFAPDVEALKSKSVLELYTMDLEYQAKCGKKAEPLPEFGPNAYLPPSALKMASVVLVSENQMAGFAVADPTLDFKGMSDKAKELTRAILAK